MRRFSIRIISFDICYNHYLSDDYVKEERERSSFKRRYPLLYYSRKFDKPAMKRRYGSSFWWLGNREHRIGKPAIICNYGLVVYYENGRWIK